MSRFFYVLIVTILLVVVGMLLYPSLHLMIGRVNTTGFLPLVSAVGVTAAPYIFLVGVGYAVYKLVRR